jgi:peptide deformylase
MILPLVPADHPALHTRASCVWTAQPTLLADLWETLHHHKALGLAAPQVGVPVRLAVVYVKNVSWVLLNPVVLWQSQEKATEEEGCLSLPGAHVLVTRPTSILLEGHGVPFEGLMARAIQHEIDHLNGTLIVDKEPAYEQVR